MSDFEFQIVGDAKRADKAIDEVLDGLDEIRRKAAQTSHSVAGSLDKVEDGLDDVERKARATAKAWDTIGLGAHNQVGRVDRLSNAFQMLSGKLGGGILAVDGFAKTLAPWNQALELAGKAIRFVDAGLDAYAKTSPRAQREVESLTKAFKGLKDRAMEAAGWVAMDLLQNGSGVRVASGSNIAKGAAIVEQLRRQKRGSFFGDDETADPLATLGSAQAGFFKTLREGTDYWNTSGQSFIDSYTKGMEKTAAAVKKATDENAAFAKSFREMQAGNQGRNYLDTTSLRPDISGGVAGKPAVAVDYTKGLSTGVQLWSETAAGKGAIATKKWNEEIEKSIELQNQLASGLGAVGAEFVSMAAAGEMSIGKLLDSLAKLALQLAAIQIGGPWGAALGAFAGGLPGFATGGSFNVGGAGGTDSQVVAFRATPGEKVTVQTPQQQGGGGNGGGTFRLVVSDERNSRRIRRDNDVEIDSSLRRLGVRR